MNSLILASSSPARLLLLKQINITPRQIISPDIDESEMKGEKGYELSLRLAREKAEHVAKAVESGFILSADTVVTVSGRILHKATNDDMVRSYLSILSGRRHCLYTSVCVIKKNNSEKAIFSIKTVESKIKFKRLTSCEIEHYIKLGEGINKAGGYSIDGYAGSYISSISGSYSNIVGLPLYETRNILLGLGYKD